VLGLHTFWIPRSQTSAVLPGSNLTQSGCEGTQWQDTYITLGRSKRRPLWIDAAPKGPSHVSDCCNVVPAADVIQ
jgi:hypothetical protein